MKAAQKRARASILVFHHVVEFLGFGVEVVLVFGVDADVQREAFGDVDAGLLQGVDFFGVVGEQADAADAEVVVDFFGEGEVARGFC